MPGQCRQQAPFTSARAGDTTCVRPDPRLPTLIFFTQATSGPARRMESLLAHVARKERARLTVRRIDAEQHPALAEKFSVEKLPALVLVHDRQIVDRIDGRASMPQIEALLGAHLPRVEALA
jgi:thioredoxin-like negative regulator of GroEL